MPERNVTSRRLRGIQTETEAEIGVGSSRPNGSVNGALDHVSIFTKLLYLG